MILLQDNFFGGRFPLTDFTFVMNSYDFLKISYPPLCLDIPLSSFFLSSAPAISPDNHKRKHRSDRIAFFFRSSSSGRSRNHSLRPVRRADGIKHTVSPPSISITSCIDFRHIHHSRPLSVHLPSRRWRPYMISPCFFPFPDLADGFVQENKTLGTVQVVYSTRSS